VPYMTTIAAAQAAVEAIETLRRGEVVALRSLQEYHAGRA
jgi:hypothetical protein